MGTLAVDNIHHTDGSSAVTLNNANITDLSAGTLGSGITFPSGHIINSSAVMTFSGNYETTSSSYVVVPLFVLGPFSFTAGNKVWVILDTELFPHNGGNDVGIHGKMSTSSTNDTDLVGIEHQNYIYTNTNYEPQFGSNVTFTNIFSPAGTSVTYYFNIKAPNGGYAACNRGRSTMQFFEIQT